MTRNFMNDTNTRQGLLILGAVVLLGAVGYWWWSARPAMPIAPIEQAEQATTTPEAAKPTAKPKAAVPAPLATDVASVAARAAEAKTFAALLKSTGVAGALKGAGPYTIFVPSDKAFALVASSVGSMTAAEKTRLVSYHVIVGKKIDTDAVYSGSREAFSGDMLNFNISPNEQVARINGASVLKTYEADNGIVYVVDRVLFPPVKGR